MRRPPSVTPRFQPYEPPSVNPALPALAHCRGPDQRGRARRPLSIRRPNCASIVQNSLPALCRGPDPFKRPFSTVPPPCRGPDQRGGARRLPPSVTPRLQACETSFLPSPLPAEDLINEAVCAAFLQKLVKPLQYVVVLRSVRGNQMVRGAAARSPVRSRCVRLNNGVVGVVSRAARTIARAGSTHHRHVQQLLMLCRAHHPPYVQVKVVQVSSDGTGIRHMTGLNSSGNEVGVGLWWVSGWLGVSHPAARRAQGAVAHPLGTAGGHRLPLCSEGGSSTHSSQLLTRLKARQALDVICRRSRHHRQQHFRWCHNCRHPIQLEREVEQHLHSGQRIRDE